ncbi:putative Anaphase-promoting complex subunit 1 [Cocos nucifera]|uniref:Putative Anaphase-promoting complex subunit 1 n=1 Tax=Cocos nucifera TaxID=13894 RepID=A0A8K0I7R4_COCNU|nr:putative Anaphase-promoting complex subunit 1 [Cocos nucifera]
MHKVCDASELCSSTTEIGSNCEPGSFKVDQLVGTFSPDPSLIAFAQLCCDSYWNNRSDSNFQEFCSQVLFECVSKDRPALLQVYLSLYTMIGSMWEQVKSGALVFQDSLFLSSLKLALAYNEALISGKLSCNGSGIIQSTFMESIRKRIEEILANSKKLRDNFLIYLDLGKWPNRQIDGDQMDAMHLSWYLLWYDIPPPHVVKSAIQKVKLKAPMSLSMVPLLHLLMPTTHAKGITEIDKFISRG